MGLSVSGRIQDDLPQSGQARIVVTKKDIVKMEQQYGLTEPELGVAS